MNNIKKKHAFQRVFLLREDFVNCTKEIRFERTHHKIYRKLVSSFRFGN